MAFSGFGKFFGAAKVADTVCRSAGPRLDMVDDAKDAMIRWLGDDYVVMTNGAGDKVFMSKDGLRKLRFDLNRPSPHENPHSHIEELINGKWHKSGAIYPADVPPY
ncbi:MAG: hypothetical protein FJ100_13825 [Deltaproteobacteria bacterium]|nr:hypothetical protein [Deltaproteobacteria bacterium]